LGKAKTHIDAERLSIKLEYEITVDSELETEEISIPPMLIQPLIENAINHGIANKEGAGKLTVNFSYRNEKSYLCTIEDDGIGLNKSFEVFN